MKAYWIIIFSPEINMHIYFNLPNSTAKQSGQFTKELWEKNSVPFSSSDNNSVSG